MKFVRRMVLATALAALAAKSATAVVVDFEELNLSAESYYDGEPGQTGFLSGDALFNNAFTDFGDFTTWEGWAYSNKTDSLTPGFGNQYSAWPGHGASESAKYGVAFTTTYVLPAARIELPPDARPISVRVANTTYAALSMRDGDAFAKKFGGDGGGDADWLRLTITGLDADDAPIGSVEHYLADFRFEDGNLDYIQTDWANVNLSSLPGARSLEFTLESSDVGQFGMNTPAYFSLDNLSVTSGPAGDADDNGAVDIFDVALVSAHWGQSGPVGDPNGDGAVDIFDVAMISANWTAGPLAAPVPEPAALFSALLGAAVLTASRVVRRRRDSAWTP